MLTRKKHRRAFLITLSAAVGVVASIQGLAQAAPGGAGSAISVASLSVDGTSDPLGIDDAAPRLGWVLQSAARAQSQSAYEVRVATSAAALAGNARWDSGKVASSDSVSVPYAGPKLDPSTRYFWQVRIWDALQRASAWSAPGWWETGLMGSSNWSGAQWIGGPPLPGPPRWPDGTTATASSTHADNGFGPYDPARAIDGDTGTFWNDDTIGAYPDVLTITAPATQSLPGITLLSDSDGVPQDFTVDTWDGSAWQQQATVTGNTDVLHQVAFAAPVSTTQVRITVTKDQALSHGEFTRVNEVYPGLYDPAGTVPAPELRKDFTVSKPVASARLYISAGGYDEPYLNGRRVGNHVLDPGFTVYDKRIQYATYDVTGDIRQGANTVGTVLGRGFYGLTTPDGWNWDSAPWHGEPRMLAKLAITYADGSQATVVSDGSWQTHASPTITDSVYLGETYDARAETPGWDTSGFDASSWAPATVQTAPTDNVVAETQPPITEHQVITAASISNPKPDVYVYKFADVTSGWARLTVNGPRGTDVTLKFGEQLNADGTVNNGNFLVVGQPQTDHYILSGDGTETWTPRFSWDGFQYIEVDGYPGTPDLNSVKAISLHTDLSTVGSFTSSNPLLNELHSIDLRTVLNNAYGILTDTPEYEKNPWLDDSQLVAGTTTDNFGMDALYENWLNDMQDSQAATGQLSVIAPDDGWGLQTAPEWSAALFIDAWQVYQVYGDASVLADHYAAMKSYLDYMQKTFPSLVFASAYGDWVAPGNAGAPPEGTEESATAFVDLDAQLLSKIAVVLGHPDDATHYAQLADQVSKVINNQFRDAATGAYHGNNPVSGRQTPDVLALALGIVPPDQVDATVADLVSNVHAADDHLNTGSMGTKYLLPTLTEHGQTDLAYKIATETTYPSLGNIASFGTGTLWEGWDQSARSHDHYMFGSYDDWFYSDLAGIQTTSPGYATVRIRPYVPAGLQNVSASIETVRGTVASHWNAAADGSFNLDVTVPVNSTAQVDVPANSQWAVAESGRLAAQSQGVHFDRMDGDRAVFTVGSGTYHFRTTPATSALGSAVIDLNTFAGSVASLTASGDLSSAQSELLDSASTGLQREADTAAGQAAANFVVAAAHQVDSALADAATADSWITAQHRAGSISDATAKTLTGEIATVTSDLSRAEALWLGVSAKVQSPSLLAAGSTAQVQVSMHNAGQEPVHDLALALAAPGGWSVSPTGPAAASALPPGATFTATFMVSSALDAAVGAGQLRASTSYRLARGTAALSQTAAIQVTPALVATRADSGTSRFAPGQPTTVTVGLADHAAVDLNASLTATADSGWTVSPGTTSVSLTAGGTATVELTVTPPADAGLSAASLRLHADYSAPNGGPQASTDVSVAVGDLARGRPATALHSLQNGPWGVANLTDGQPTSTSADEGYTSDPFATVPNSEEWVQVDLGAQSAIGSVTLYPRTQTPADGGAATDGIHFPADFTIQVSDDGTSWTTARTVTGQTNPGANPQTYALGSATGRYLRIDVTNLGAEFPNDFYRLQLAELEVDGVSIR